MFRLKILVMFFILAIGSTSILGQVTPQVTNAVVVGGVTENSARFWCRLSAAGKFAIQLSTSAGFQNLITSQTITVTAESNFAGIANAASLSALTKYFYRVVVNDTIADTIQRYFSTFPLKGISSNFSFAFGSCQQSGNFLPSGTPSGNVFREIKRKAPAFFLQIGDWCYPDTTDNTPFDNDYFSNVFEYVQKSYEGKFSSYYPMDSLMRICPVDYVYDDHDFMNDNASATTASFAVPFRPNPLSNDFVVMEIPALPDARLNSIRGYKENMPTYPLVNESRGIYHKFTYGNCEFYMLDLRSQRTPNLSALQKNTVTGKWEFKPGADRTILGRDNSLGAGESQLTWFLNNLN
ncbi:MAG: alkaline phosphatase D family protein [Ignavibacteriales bacterium]|nr:alkaline phosphatase D family protein [Ignavibacteriales bacterium]